jgi:hypothetical protein
VKGVPVVHAGYGSGNPAELSDEECMRRTLMMGLLLCSGVWAAQELTPEQAGAVARAQQALQARTSDVVEDKYTLVGVEARTWSDSSLGCPRPGVMYQQVITSGYAVTLRDEQRSYVVHVAGERAVICDSVMPGVQRPRARATQLPRLEALAREDLASKLGVNPEEVRVVRRVPTQWTLAELECRDATDTGQAKVRGYKLYLRHRRQQYTYHTDDARVFACPAIARQ